MGEVNRFVIQRHTREGRSVHWDLMFESGGILETYRLDLPPGELRAKGVEVTKIFDHPLKFLTYEGSVNEGRGSVSIEESGTYALLERGEDSRSLDIHGSGLKGRLHLTHITGDKWELSFSP